MKGCCVYVLGTVSGGQARTYTGWTYDLEARLVAHNSGRGAKATRGREWVLLLSEPCADKSKALVREAELKKQLRQNPTLRAELLAPLLAE